MYAPYRTYECEPGRRFTTHRRARRTKIGERATSVRGYMMMREIHWLGFVILSIRQRWERAPRKRLREWQQSIHQRTRKTRKKSSGVKMRMIAGTKITSDSITPDELKTMKLNTITHATAGKREVICVCSTLGIIGCNYLRLYTRNTTVHNSLN